MPKPIPYSRRVAVAKMFEEYTNAELVTEIDEKGEGLTVREVEFVGDLVDKMKATSARRRHTGEDFPLTTKQRRWLELIGADRLPPVTR